MGWKILAAWRWLPALVRAPIVAFVVLNIGATATALPLFGNLKFHPEIPWAFPATLIVLAMFWYYFTGGGFPVATREVRQSVARRKSLPWPIWRATALPLLFSVIAVASFRLVLPSILPVEAPKVPFDLNAYPFLTVAGILFSIIVSAGVVEEVAFRGYLQKPLEDAYGILPALFLTGIAFWLAHIDKVSFSHLPFHLLVSILLGLAAYLTKSLLPAIVGHAAGDALLQPAYLFQKPTFVWSALTAKPVWEHGNATAFDQKARLIMQAMAPSNLTQPGSHQIFAILAWAFIVSAILTAIFFVRLERVSRTERLAGP